MSKKKEMESNAIQVRLAERRIEERDLADAVKWARGESEGKQLMDESEGRNL